MRSAGSSIASERKARRCLSRHHPHSLYTQIAPFPALVVRARFRVLPCLEALAVYRGEFECTNEDLIRNSAYNWSPMTAQDIRAKTGIDSRRYTELELGHMALLTACSALEHAGRKPGEIGAVLFCSCTSTRLMP